MQSSWILCLLRTSGSYRNDFTSPSVLAVSWGAAYSFLYGHHSLTVTVTVVLRLMVALSLIKLVSTGIRGSYIHALTAPWPLFIHNRLIMCMTNELETSRLRHIEIKARSFYSIADSLPGRRIALALIPQACALCNLGASFAGRL